MYQLFQVGTTMHNNGSIFPLPLPLGHMKSNLDVRYTNHINFPSLNIHILTHPDEMHRSQFTKYIRVHLNCKHISTFDGYIRNKIK